MNQQQQPQIIYIQEKRNDPSFACVLCLSFTVSLIFSPIVGLCLFCCFRTRELTKAIFLGIGIDGLLWGAGFIAGGALLNNVCNSFYFGDILTNTNTTGMTSGNFSSNASLNDTFSGAHRLATDSCRTGATILLAVGSVIAAISALLLGVVVVMFMNDGKKKQIEPAYAPETTQKAF
jgi:hypothetical protein